MTSLLQGLSTTCTTALAPLVATGDLSTCLALTSFLADFAAVGPTDSVVAPLNTYLTSDICGKSACSAATLSSAGATIQSGCTAELSATTANGAQLIMYLLTNYGKVRDAGCLENTASNNGLCITETLTTIQTDLKTPLTLNVLLGLFNNQTAQTAAFTAVAGDKTGICTDCAHGLTTVLFTDKTTQFAKAIGGECGATFLDGQLPASVKNGSASSTAGTTTSTGKPDAAAGLPLRGALIAGVAAAVFAAVAVL